MQVAIKYMVDIDVKAWEANYGVSASDPAAFREDVRNYCEHGMRDQLSEVGVLLESSR